MPHNLKIKVSMICPYFPLTEDIVEGGLQGVSLYLCKELLRINDIELEVIRPFSEKLPNEDLIIGGIKVHLVEKENSKPNIFLDYDREKTFRYLKISKPDFVHIQGLPIWASKCEYPNVVTIHGIREIDALFNNTPLIGLTKYLYFKLIENFGRKNAKNIIAINPYIYKFIGKGAKATTWDIANPVNDSFFKANWNPTPGVVFSASKITPIKNIKKLIKSIFFIKKNFSGIHLRLAGSLEDQKYFNECKKLVNDLGLVKNITFLGQLSTHEVKEELSRASCFISCSRQENSPLSISEAMAVGLPIIAPRIGGIPWMVNEGKNGVLVRGNSAKKYAEAFELINFKEKILLMGSESKKMALQAYKADVVAKKTRDVYFQILDLVSL